MENSSSWAKLLYWSIVYCVSYIPTTTTALLQNVALLKGQTLTHRCNLSIEATFHSWYFIPFGERFEKVIYSTKGLNGEYVKRAQVDNTSLVLTIPSIQLDDAGRYGCKSLSNSTVIHERAQVIVIESNLQICNNEASGLTCEVKYKGNFGPAIEWIKDGSSELTAIKSFLINDSDANGTRHLTLMTNYVNSTLTCQLYFKDFPTHFENIATNMPTYTDRCNSSDCCNSSSGTKIKDSTPPNEVDHWITQETAQETTKTIIYSITIASGVIIVILIIYISKRICSVQAIIPTSSVDDIQQADIDSSAQIGEPQRFRRLGYEEMQEHESPSESFYVRLNPADTTARPLPYVNVTLEERSSDTLASRNDRPQQYLNVVIEDAACSMSDGVIAVKMQSYVNVSLQRERDIEEVEL